MRVKKMKGAALAALIAAAPLGGCASAAAKLADSADRLYGAGRDYVAENIERRREIRRRCWELTQARVAQLERDGDLEGAREVLRAAYPPLVTVGALRRLLDEEEAQGGAPDPSGC